MTEGSGRMRSSNNQQRMSSYEQLLNAISAAIYILDAEGRFLFVNEAAAKTYGYPGEYFLGKTPEFLSAPGKNDLEMVSKAVRDALNGIPRDFPFWGLKKDGQIFPKEVHLRKGRFGNKDVVVATAFDVTERMAFEEREKWLVSIVDHSLNEIYVFDSNTFQFYYANEGALRNMGYTLEELQKMTPLDIKPEFTREEFVQLIEPLKKGLQDNITFQTIHKRKNGTVYDVFLSLQPAEMLEKTFIVAVALDISEHVKEQGELRLRMTALEAVGDAIAITDRNGTIEWVNDAFTKLTGYSKNEVIGNNPRILKSGVQDKTFYEELWQTILSGKIWRGILVNKRKDGTFYSESMSITPVRDETDNIRNFIAVKRDDTERVKAVEELRESEEKFRMLAEYTPAAIWIHDVEKFLYVNLSAERITGYSADELYGINPMSLVHPDFRAMVMEKAKQRISGKEVPSHYEYKIITKSGEERWIDFSGAMIKYRGSSAIIGSAYDITESKKTQEQFLQAQKLEGLGRLAGGVAHDFNNMLGVIIGYADLAIRKIRREDPVYHYAELIGSAARRGAELTKQLLAFARKEIISPKILNPNSAIRSIAEMLRRLIGENIKFEFIPGEDLWNIQIDPAQFDQILVNLATNARDAIDDVGTVTIETFNAVLDDTYVKDGFEFLPGEYVVISFTDTGKGMDEEVVQRIYEPFFTTKPKGQGTGLGLSTVYGIVKQNGGNINVYSEVGQGTTFKIYLPRYIGDAEKIEAAPEAGSYGGSETILIVEDQANLLELAKNTLEIYGYRVLTALSPGDAILVCEAYQDEIHLLLTDVVMPVMNGRELSERIRAMKPNVKVLYMSGYTANVIAHRGVLEEGIDFIQKPFTPVALAKKVRQVLDS
ncbi:MAG: PAS domain S-box protein [Candidatus Kryptoniota bacterium]